MSSILDHCDGAEQRDCAAGAVLLAEGETSGLIFVLAEGEVEILRGETQVALVSDPGAIFGEMSVLLGVPHTATVRTVAPSRLFLFPDAEQFLRSHPAIGFHLARLLAQRLNSATTYLVDIKRQFEDRHDHLGMLGEVLESLMHQQDDSGFEALPQRRPDDPRL